jgi:Kef-type K+ transport system membrane component KefB
MKKVLIYSMLLIAGLVGSQLLPSTLGPSYDALMPWIQALTMVALSYIMIGVGREFEIDKSNLKQYGWDYVVGATAAAFPWIFCCLYFIYVILPPEAWTSWPAWKETLLASRFAAPTSAGVLFSMLAAAGLAATWVFKKARILAIFDDLDTILLMIPLKMAMVGMKWQLGVVVIFMAIMLWIAYKWLHQLRIPSGWKMTLLYSIVMVGIVTLIHKFSLRLDPMVPIHIEVLLPAFVLGCVMKLPDRKLDKNGDAILDHEEHAHERVGTIVSAAFMLLVGLSMPSVVESLRGGATPVDGEAAKEGAGLIKHALSTMTPAMGWGTIAMHVLAVTALANLGKMFPALCYRREATLRERLAVAIGMWPRGEVGAGVLVISLSYGIGGPIVVIAMLSLALNLVMTGVFILIVKKLLSGVAKTVH